MLCRLCSSNARDRDGFLGLLAEDVELRNPLGNTVRGSEAASDSWDASVQAGVFVEQDGAERVDGQQVAVPTIMRMADDTELRSAGVFEVRDGETARARSLRPRLGSASR